MPTAHSKVKDHRLVLPEGPSARAEEELSVLLPLVAEPGDLAFAWRRIADNPDDIFELTSCVSEYPNEVARSDTARQFNITNDKHR